MPLVRCIMLVLFPITKPLAFCLDVVLGQEFGTIYSKNELVQMLKIHERAGQLDGADIQEVEGALRYKNKQASQVMTSIDEVYMVSEEATLNFSLLRDIFTSGFSRIPVYAGARNNITGLLFVKDLIFIDPEDAVPVKSFQKIFLRSIERVWDDDNLGDVLNLFKKGRGHLALVQTVVSMVEL